MRPLLAGLVLAMVADVRFGWLRRLFRSRTATESDDRQAGAESAGGSQGGHPQHEFHVVGNKIRIVFEVPLPDHGVDDVLRDLLLHHGLEIIRDRKRRGQPLDQIKTAIVFAKRAGVDVEIGSLDLTQPEGPPEIARPMLVPLGASPQEDPLRKLGDPDIKKVIPVAQASELDELSPVGTDLKLTTGLAAGLRAKGIDPDHMTAAQLGVGLLEVAGYVMSKRSDDVFIASGGGLTTYVRFVNHKPGSYPELEAREITEFLVGFGAAHTDRALLITDKFGPYEIYKKERANPRCHFITRERMQAFVDSIALS